MIIQFDATLAGLFTAIYLTYHEIEKSTFQTEQAEPSFFENQIQIKTNPEYARKVERAIIQKFGGYFLQNIKTVFRSADPERYTVIAKVIKGKFLYTDDFLYSAQKAAIKFNWLEKNVSRETHTYKGLLRFRQVKDNYLFAEIEPQNNILDLLSKYFQQRMPQEKFMIFDKNRHLLSLYDGTKSHCYEIMKPNVENSSKNQFFEECWLAFYQAVKIEDRENLKLMQSNMPKKYWKYLPERKRFDTLQIEGDQEI